MDPQTGRTGVRMVNMNSFTYQSAYKFMIRLKPENARDPMFLPRITMQTNLSAEAFKARYGYLAGLALVAVFEGELMVDANACLFTTAAGHPAVEVRFRVRYFETNVMGTQLTTPHTLPGLRRAAAHSRLGYPYSRMEEEGNEPGGCRGATRATTTRRATTTKCW